MLRIMLVAVVALLQGSLLWGAEFQFPVKLPASTGAIVKLSSPESTVKSVADAADELQKGWGNIVSGQTTNLGNLISNPTMSGVDQTKDWYVAVFPSSEGEPGILFIIPAKNIDDMEEAIPAEFEFIKVSGYGLYTNDEEVAKLVKESAAGKGDLLKFSAGQATEIFSKTHLGIYVNVPFMMTEFKDNWKEGREEFMDEFEKGLTLSEDSVNVESYIEIMNKIVDKIEKGLNESEAFVAGITLNKESVNFEEFLSVKEGSSFQKLLNRHAPGNPKLLSHLPVDSAAYFSFTGEGEKALNWLIKGVTKFNGKVLIRNDRQNEKFNTAMKTMAEVDFAENSFSLSLGDASTGLINLNSIVGVKPTEKWSTAIEQFISSQDEFIMESIKYTYKYEKNAESVGEHKVDKFTTEINSDDEGIGEIMEQFIKYAYGPDGAVYRFTNIEGNSLQSMGNGVTGITKGIEAYNKKVGFAEGTASKRDRLLVQEKVNFLMMVDYVGLVQQGLEFAANLGNIPLPFSAEDVENIKLQRSYVTMGISSEKAGIHFKTCIPILTIKNGVTLGTTLMKSGANSDF